MLDIKIVSLGERRFLQIENVCSIPIDRIKHFDLNAANGGCDNSVRIVTDDDEEEWYFSYENADAIREFLRENII